MLNTPIVWPSQENQKVYCNHLHPRVRGLVYAMIAYWRVALLSTIFLALTLGAEALRFGHR